MSGGKLCQYNQYNLHFIAEEIQQLINNNNCEELNSWGDPIGKQYPEAVVKRFKEAVPLLRKAYVYAQRIDWLISGDDGPESFIQRIQDDLKELNEKYNEDSYRSITTASS